MWLALPSPWTPTLLCKLTGCWGVSSKSLGPLETSRQTRWPLASVQLGPCGSELRLRGSQSEVWQESGSQPAGAPLASSRLTPPAWGP